MIPNATIDMSYIESDQVVIISSKNAANNNMRIAKYLNL